MVGNANMYVLNVNDSAFYVSYATYENHVSNVTHVRLILETAYYTCAFHAGRISLRSLGYG